MLNNYLSIKLDFAGSLAEFFG